MVTYGVLGCKINLPVSEKRQPEADDRLNLHLNIVVYIYYILWQNHIENGRSLQYDICKCVSQCVCVCVLAIESARIHIPFLDAWQINQRKWNFIFSVGVRVTCVWHSVYQTKEALTVKV